MRPCQFRHFAFAITAASTLLLGAKAGAAIDLTTPTKVSGQWDMSLNDTNRKCRLTLRADAGASCYAIAMPAGCRRAMPILSDVGTWLLPSGSLLQLADAGGKAVLDFTLADGGKLSASGPEGETYELVAANALPGVAVVKPAPPPGLQPLPPPVGGPALSPSGSAKPAAAVPAAAPPAVAKPPTAAALLMKVPDVAGRYSVFRESGKDTGCMLTLDEKARGINGNKAQLAPACRDQGLVIFDPAGWALEKGRLTLTARKGHQTHLDLQPDGIWMKDPKEGKGLSLKKF